MRRPSRHERPGGLAEDELIKGGLLELASTPKAPPALAHADLATEADGSAVSLRAALPPDELVRLFTAVSSRAHVADDQTR